ncbi:MAG: hypothetical protein ACK4P3_09420 [Fimbriimonadaceae bacterium]|jgi:hypothetical protein
MVDRKDLEAIRMVRREFNRRKVDCAEADVRVLHGVLYVRGSLKGFGDVDVRHELEVICRALRQTNRVREIVLDVKFR